MRSAPPLPPGSAAPERAAPPSTAWWLVSAAAALGALLAAVLGEPGALRWQPELALRQPWRAISAAWVHLSPLHLMANLTGTAVVAVLGTVAGCGPRAALAWALAWPLTHAALALQPALDSYGGLSGVLHAGVAVAGWQLLRAERGRRQAIGAALLVGLIVKVLIESPWAGPGRFAPGWDFAVAPAAHASGSLAGLLCAWACGVGRSAVTRVSPRPKGSDLD